MTCWSSLSWASTCGLRLSSDTSSSPGTLGGKDSSASLHMGEFERSATEVSRKRKSTTSLRPGTFEFAMAVARDLELRDSAVKELENDFWAASNKAAKLSKRKLIVDLAQAVGGPWWVPPLTENVVLGVAAALKAAGLKSASSLMNELKLWHVEQGYDVSHWLARLLTLTRKSLSRNLGPIKRAVELKLQDIEGRMWACAKHDEVSNPALAYAWATVWMLRCAELVAVKFEHVVINVKERTVTLKIPVSKMDQAGWGVKRTLGCCRKKTCDWSCAWKLWSEIVKRRPESEWLFGVSNYDGKATAKMVAAWKAVLCLDVTGHSARRSGAMMYVREALPLQEVAFLGRWKSNIVLIYAEEALEEMPANRRLCPQGASRDAGGVPCWKAPRTPKTLRMGGDDTLVQMTPGIDTGIASTPPRDANNEKTEMSHHKIPDVTFGKPKDLWVYSKRDNRSNPSRHLVAVAGWDVPMSEWKTACGWPFAREKADAAFSYVNDFSKKKCRKCLLYRSKRDGVSEATVKRVASGALMSVLNDEVACTEDAATPPPEK